MALVARPGWLRGRNNGAALVRNEVFFDLLPAPAAQVDQDVLSRCGLCWGAMDFNGAQAEHLVDWRAFASDHWGGQPAPVDLRALEDAYHEKHNIYAGHGGCNASKGAQDIFDWWKSDNCNLRVDLLRRTRLRTLLGELFDRTGIDWLYEFPMDRRKDALRLIQETVSDPNWASRAGFLDALEAIAA